MELICRPMREDEALAVSELLKRVFRKCIAPAYREQGRREFLFFAEPEELARRMADGNRMWVAEAARQVIGMAEVRGASHLLLLFVDLGHQRQGVGRALLGAAFPRFAAGDPPRVTVNAAPNSIAAYARLGFRQTGPQQAKTGILFVPMEARMAGTTP